MISDSSIAPLRVLGICGSLRRGSFNRALLNAAHELAPDGMHITDYEGLREIPPYDADVDAAGAPEPVAVLRRAIAEADALLIATPEYNYSIPGVLKNAIDWASRPPATTPLRDKPTAIMGASSGMSGTMRAQYHLRQSFVFTRTPCVLQPELLCAFAGQKIDAEGRVTDETTRSIMRKLLEQLVVLVERYQAVPQPR
jgi:chromate reductase